MDQSSIICKKCSHQTICRYMTEHYKLLQKLEAIDNQNPDVFTITIKCNNFLEPLINYRGDSDPLIK